MTGWRVWAVGAAVAAASAAALVAGVERRRPATRCGAGFVPLGARCCDGTVENGRCIETTRCPRPLVADGGRCRAPDARVFIPETELTLGPSDWEAEGVVPPRTLHVRAFWLDAFEAVDEKGGLRAAYGVTRRDAEARCLARGGRLPTDDEWTAAAAGREGRRYPWGQTGAVCRRAAWGLVSGPCGSGGDGPDTVGAHADGDTPNGLHDMAGNVAEWVADEGSGTGLARGGHWRSALAAELRTWARLEVDPEAKDDRIGFRCAYDSPAAPPPADGKVRSSAP